MAFFILCAVFGYRSRLKFGLSCRPRLVFWSRPQQLNDKFGTWFVYKYASVRNLKDQQNGFPQNFSTQKITRVFITAVVIGWSLMTVWNLFCLFCSYYNPDLSALRHCQNNDVINKIIKLLYVILGLLLTSGIWLVLHIHFISGCRSTIKYMTTQIDKDNSEVEE